MIRSLCPGIARGQFGSQPAFNVSLLGMFVKMECKQSNGSRWSPLAEKCVVLKRECL